MMAPVATKYYILRDLEDDPSILLSQDGLDIKQWQPESQEWIDAPWLLDDLVGPNRSAEEVTAEDAAEIQADNPFEMTDMSDEDIQAELKEWRDYEPDPYEMGLDD